MENPMLTQKIDEIISFCQINQNLCITNKYNADEFLIFNFKYFENLFELYISDNQVFIKSDNQFIQNLNVQILKQKHTEFKPVLELILTNINKYNQHKMFNFWDNNVSNKWDKLIINLKNKEIETRSKNQLIYKNIPKNLLFQPKQIFSLVINELKNTLIKNTSWIIDPVDDNLYLLNAVYKINESSNHFGKLDKLGGFNFRISIDPILYPFVPPQFTLISPKINRELSDNLHQLEFIRLENWNPSNSFSFLLDSIEYVIENYAKITDTQNSEYSELEIVLDKLQKTTNDVIPFIKNIKINYNKIFSSKTEETKYWKSGVGYGTDDVASKWDIKEYIIKQEQQSEQMSILFDEITNIVSNSQNRSIIENSCLFDILFSRLHGTSLVELDKYSKLYYKIFNLLNVLGNYEWDDTKIKPITKSLDDINTFITDVSQLNKDIEIGTHYQFISSVYQKYTKYNVVSDIVVNDIDYLTIMKKTQFSSCKFIETNVYHLFRDLVTKSKISKSAIMRITKEYADLKTSLPLNWESSVWFRIDTNYMNCIKFMISGPKDTPYENGLFLFNAFIPNDYPNSPPQVLLETTGGQTFRFNPNLYDCGKVCLSLLNTWTGREEEKWNEKTSTLLQVIVSIQSLIFVENPYFNEPGWERDMHTTAGKQKSEEYSDKIRLHTLKLAMVDMMKNMPSGFENVVTEYLKFKKTEILTQADKWTRMTRSRNQQFQEINNQIIELLNKF